MKTITNAWVAVENEFHIIANCVEKLIALLKNSEISTDCGTFIIVVTFIQYCIIIAHFYY